MFEWKNFLHQWVETSQTSEVPASLQPGAAEAEIAALEARLGRKLPPSYRAFLGASNGFINAGYAIDRIRPAHEVDWLAAQNQDLIDIWVTPELIEVDPSTEHLKTILQISDEGDSAFLLLNPNVIDRATGEWEAWFFASWSAGWDIYDSFQEMMEDKYQTFLLIEADKSQRAQVANAPQEVKAALGDMAAQWQQMADQMTAGLSDTFNMDTLMKMMFPNADQRGRMEAHMGELTHQMDSFNQRMLQWVQAHPTGLSTAYPFNAEEAQASAAQFQNIVENIRAEAQTAAPEKMDFSVLPDLDTLNDALLKLGTMQGLNIAAGQLRGLLNTPPEPPEDEADDQ